MKKVIIAAIWALAAACTANNNYGGNTTQEKTALYKDTLRSLTAEYTRLVDQESRELAAGPAKVNVNREVRKTALKARILELQSKIKTQ